MNKIQSIFKLVRWPNLLMITIMMILVYYCLMSPLFASGIIGVMPSPPAFLLLVMSMIFIVAGGYVINDYFDVEIDKVNKPEKLIVSRIFSEKEALFFYRILTFIGLALGLVSCILIINIKFLTLFALLILLTSVLYSYSSIYKRKFLIGNIIVSLSVAFAVFLPWLFEMLYLSNNELLLMVSKEMVIDLLPIVLVYTLFAFLTTLMREIVKDAEDSEGDISTRCRTIPILCGMKMTKIIVAAIAMLLFVVLIYFHILLIRMQSNVSMFILMFAECILLLIVINLFRAKSSSDFHGLSTSLKLFMLVGILTMIFIC